MLSRETREELRKHLDARPINLVEASSFWSDQSGSGAFTNPLLEPLAAIAREVLKLDKIPKEKLIVDAGCGRGILAKQLAKEGHKVIGVDIQRHPDFPETLFMRGHLGKLPLQDNSAHALVTDFALPYTNMKESMKEIMRVMAPGAPAFVAVHHSDMLEIPLENMMKAFGIPPKLADPLIKSMAPALARQDNPFFRILANVFSNREEGREFFERQGFNVIRSEDLTDPSRTKHTGLAFWYHLGKPNTA